MWVMSPPWSRINKNSIKNSSSELAIFYTVFVFKAELCGKDEVNPAVITEE